MLVTTVAEQKAAAEAARKVGGWRRLIELSQAIAAGGDRRRLIRNALATEGRING